jgi:hypothetical protein
MVYRFVGSSVDLGGRMVERFGEKVELDEAFVRELADRNCFLPDADFAACGFTPTELEANYSTQLHVGAKTEFIAKRDKAWAALAAYRKALKTPSADVVAPIVPVKEGE